MSKVLSFNSINKTDAAKLMIKELKPVVFWDTCMLLDIVRLPIPDRNHSVDLFQKVIAIKNKIVSNEIISLSSVLCVNEFNKHIDNTKSELIKAAKSLTNTHNNFIGFINKYNFGGLQIPEIDLSVYKLEESIMNIVESIIRNTFFINEDQKFSEFATFRTINGISPAKKKGEFKDCYIWGSCLESKKLVNNNSFPLYFMSSNTTDYADDSKIEFVDEIGDEAKINGIIYFSNFNIAYGKLKSTGVI